MSYGVAYVGKGQLRVWKETAGFAHFESINENKLTNRMETEWVPAFGTLSFDVAKWVAFDGDRIKHHPNRRFMATIFTYPEWSCEEYAEWMEKHTTPEIPATIEG
jgi:hypothetical protein